MQRDEAVELRVDVRGDAGGGAVVSLQPRQTRVARLPRSDEDRSRYLHPNGYVIESEKRSWSERVGAMRGASLAGPLTWWGVYLHRGSAADLDVKYRRGAVAPRGHRADFDTLHEARAWCDEHPREGW